MAVDVSTGTQHRSFGRRVLETPTFGPLVALLLACLFFTWKTDTFMTTTNLSRVLGQMSYLGVLAIGQTLIILTAGIDLSIGVIMAMGAAVVAKTSQNGIDFGPLQVRHLAWPLAVVLGLAVCSLLGLVNGLLIERVKLPPFIATLGLYGILYTFVHVYLDNTTVQIKNAQGLPDDKSPLTWLGRTLKFGNWKLTYGTILALLLFGIAAYILNQTAFGRHVFAFGDDPDASRLSGIKTERLRIFVYALAGFVYGIGAMVYLARIGSATPNDGQTENLETITAVVIGGTSLFGGRGTVLGSLIGAIIVFVFRNGLVQMGVRSEWQSAVTGAMLILAVALDQYLKKRRN